VRLTGPEDSKGNELGWPVLQVEIQGKDFVSCTALKYKLD